MPGPGEIRPPSEREAPPRTEPGTTDPGPTTSAMAQRIRAGVVQTAITAIGTPYEWGGDSRNGFDCSGLIQYAYDKYGISLPRVSTDQIRQGVGVELNPDLFLPGDILGFSLNAAGRVSHVGLYIGEGEFIHSGSNGVGIAEIENPYWVARLVAARRVVEG